LHAKAGIKCIVFEKHVGQSVHARDWNMGLHWAAPVLQSLTPAGHWERIQSVQVDPTVPTKENDTLIFMNAQTGERMGGATMERFYRLVRSKLRKLLAEGVEVKYGKKLTKIVYNNAESVSAEFDDGSSVKGRIIVGADGAGSSVRRLLVGQEAGTNPRIPFCATFIQARYTREQALHLRHFHPLYLAGLHPGGYFSFFGTQDASDADRPETWVFFFYISWPCSLEEQQKTASWTEADRLRQAKQFSKHYADPWKSAYDWLPDDHPVSYHSMSDWDPGAEGHHWDNHRGLVTLAGDAAHTMTYQRGQGLNHSITDARKLTDAIQSFIQGQSSQDASIADYEKEMVTRAGEEVRLSTKNTAMLHNWEMVTKSPVMTNGMKKT